MRRKFFHDFPALCQFASIRSYEPRGPAISPSSNQTSTGAAVSTDISPDGLRGNGVGFLLLDSWASAWSNREERRESQTRPPVDAGCVGPDLVCPKARRTVRASPGQ